VQSIDTLYQEIILDHFRAPRGEGTLDSPTAAVDSNNPLCGDEVHLEVRIEDGKIAEIGHTGQGCSISRSAVSMLAEQAVGLEVDEALGVIEHFRLMLHGDEPPDEDRLGDAIALEGVAKFPARIKCALLGWMALKEALLPEPVGGGN